MRRHVVLGGLTLAAVAVFGNCSDNDAGPEITNFTATLAKAPIGTPDTNSTTATGSATLSVVGGTIVYRIDVTGISNVTLAHIHGPMLTPGGSAGVIVNFCGTTQGGTPTTPPCASGTVTGVLVSGVSSLTPGAGMTFDRLVTLLKTDSAYVNVHTTAHPGGEIRGTITAQ